MSKIAFKRHPLADERRRSAIALVKLLREAPELMPYHRRKFLNLALWEITEAEAGKYRTRFRSRAAQSSTNTKELRHDHVFQRALMTKRLLDASLDRIDDILDVAIGCTITKDEHARLNEFKNLDGWDRYLQAGIVVIDSETGEAIEFFTEKHIAQ